MQHFSYQCQVLGAIVDYRTHAGHAPDFKHFNTYQVAVVHIKWDYQDDSKYFMECFDVPPKHYKEVVCLYTRCDLRLAYHKVALE